MVKEKSKGQNIHSVLLLLGLAFLLLLSPCKVKNYFQTQFGVAATTVLNKSQSPKTPSSCQPLAFSKAEHQLAHPVFPYSLFLCSNGSQVIFSNEFAPALAPLNSPRKAYFPLVPLYILFQNLKVYL